MDCFICKKKADRIYLGNYSSKSMGVCNNCIVAAAILLPDRSFGSEEELNTYLVDQELFKE